MVEVKDRNERILVGDVIYKLTRVFRHVEREIAEHARTLYRSGIDDPRDEALYKYIEEGSSYQRPVVKIMGVAKGGVRI